MGIFSSGGDIHQEGQLIADRDTLMAAARRPNFNSVLARLDNAPDAMDRLHAALSQNPALSVMAERHSTYYENLSGDNAIQLNVVAYTVGGIMAVGAMFGALKIMVGAVSARRQEIGTLRALGFGALPVAMLGGEQCTAVGADRGVVIVAQRPGVAFVQRSAEGHFGNVSDLEGDAGAD